MRPITVQPQKDFLENISMTNPYNALAEIIWNGFDANSDKVEVFIRNNSLGGIDSIEVRDAGYGIDHSKLNEYFGQLGGSWKKSAKKLSNSLLHGENGQGRFKVYALDEQVRWETIYNDGNTNLEYTIKGDINQIAQVLPSEPEITDKQVGTSVYIDNLIEKLTLPQKDTQENLARIFCFYLSKHPNKKLFLDTIEITPSLVQESVDNYDLGDLTLKSGKKVSLKISIVQWKNKSEGIIHLCDENGFVLGERKIKNKLRVNQKNISVYATSDYFKELCSSGTLETDLDSDSNEILEIIEDKIKKHFVDKDLKNKSKIIENWISEGIYPYNGEDSSDAIKNAERQVFDILAVNVANHLDKFEKQNKKSKQFTFTLLKQAIENNPESVQKIISEVLGLKKEEQDDLANLLKQTTLSSVIKSAQIITDRLNFIKGLEQLLFDKETKKTLLERDQLHKILERESWIFREDFALAGSEDTLNELLEKHITSLKKDDIDLSNKVIQANGKSGRVDLFFSKSRQPREGEFEHLVVELKRPSKKIDQEVLGQIKGYAGAISKDERFDKSKTKWIFIAVSNELDDSVENDVNQLNRPKGLALDTPNHSVWIYTWGEIINQAKSKYTFFSDQLKYKATRDSATEYLKKVHGQFIPKLADKP